MLDPPGHTAFRRLVARGFTPRQVAGIEFAPGHFVRRYRSLPFDAEGRAG